MVHVIIDMSLPENQDPKPQLEDDEFIEVFTTPLKDLWAECKRLEAADYAIDARVGTLAEGIEIAKQVQAIVSKAACSHHWEECGRSLHVEERRI